LHLLVACECKPPQPVRLGSDGLDVCLTDNLRRRGRTEHCAEPAQVGRAPVGLSRLADIVPQYEGFAPQLGRLQIPEHIFPRPAQVAERFSVDGGDRDQGEVTRAHQLRQL
jgi:hypothetical protein